jgi:type I restriction enzyme, S subunit
VGHPAQHGVSKASRATRQVKTLTQALLAQAFRGELVPTEAELARQENRAYEPAAVILERILKQKNGEKTAKETRRNATKSRKV